MKLHEVRFTAMASPCRLLFFAANALLSAVAAEAAIEEVARIERRYSRYRQDSEISRINRAGECGGSVEVDEETAALLDFAFTAYARSDGLFDITSGLLRRAWDFQRAVVPGPELLAPLLERIGLSKVVWRPPRLQFTRPGMELDFGGFGKEYAVDRAAAVLASYGIAHGLVDLGGDVAILGPQAGGEPWNIGIRHPRHSTRTLVTLALSAGALATSGDYERCIEIDGRRHCHILDPRTGASCRGLMSVSVAASSCLSAGAFATTAMLRGTDGARWLRQRQARHLVVDESGQCGGNLAGSAAGPVL